MPENPFNLSNVALQITAERPLVWEYRLFAQVIADEVEATKSTYKFGSPPHTYNTDPLEFIDLLTWTSNSMDEFTGLVEGLSALVSLNHEDAFGPPGKPGDVSKIVAYSRAISSYYSQTMEWSEVVRNTPIDPQYAVIADELYSCRVCVITGIEQFLSDLQAQLRDFLNEPASQTRRTITVHLTVDIPTTDRLKEAMDRLLDETKNRQLDKFTDIMKQISSVVGYNILEEVQNLSQSKAGYIYVLINPSMDGLVKIGKTSRDPKDRVKELGAVTGVPTPFILVFDAYVNDCDQAEKYIHARLKHKRVADNREFFRDCSIITESGPKRALL